MTITNVFMKSIVNRQLYHINLLMNQMNNHDYESARSTLVNMNNHIKSDLLVARQMYFKSKCTESGIFFSECLEYKTKINKFYSKLM